MKRTGLKKAARLFRARKFAELISLLEPQVFLYRDNFQFYFLLGASCFYTKDYGGADSYLHRAVRLDPNNLDARNFLAATLLRRRKTDDALQIWLEVIEEDPKNRTARRGLDLIRRKETPEEAAELADSIAPKPAPYIPSFVYIALAVGLVVLASGLLAPRIISALSPEPDAPDREGVDVVQFDPQGIGRIAIFTGDFRYDLSEEEIIQSFARIEEYFNSYQDNLAMREINRILWSNASESMKERVLVLRDFLGEPSFADFDSSFSYQEVRLEPLLYDRTYVRWSGRITNIEMGETEAGFDLLVGYADGRVLEGIVPVRLDFPAELDASFGLEVLGQVLVREDETFGLRGVSIRRLALDNN